MNEHYEFEILPVEQSWIQQHWIPTTLLIAAFIVGFTLLLSNINQPEYNGSPIAVKAIPEPLSEEQIQQQRNDALTILEQLTPLLDTFNQQNVELPKVFQDQLDKADNAYAKSEYQQALTFYQQALTQAESLRNQIIEAVSVPITESSTEIKPSPPELATDNKLINDDKHVINNLLSKAFSSLKAEQYEQAINQFNQILDIQADNSAAKNGLTEVETAKHLALIKRHLNLAKQAEQQEQWTLAMSYYDKLLSLAPHHVTAKEKRNEATVLARWHRQLDELIKEPVLLSLPDINADANNIIQLIESVQMPDGINNTQLNGKLVTLKNLLVWVNEDLSITLLSDGKTEIIIKQFGIGSNYLGTFTEQPLLLKPGEYQLLGKRQGYRDVLLSINLDSPDTDHQFTIVCTESLLDRT